MVKVSTTLSCPGDCIDYGASNCLHRRDTYEEAMTLLLLGAMSKDACRAKTGFQGGQQFPKTHATETGLWCHASQTGRIVTAGAKMSSTSMQVPSTTHCP